MTSVTASSGNVFEDLDLPDAEELKVKADIVMGMNEIIRRKGLNLSAVGLIVGLSNVETAKLLRGRTSPYRKEDLVRYAKRLRSFKRQAGWPIRS